MIKTPLSTMIGGAFWTPCATILGLSSQNLTQLIKSLFANNEQGFAYDPNDLTDAKIKWRRNLFTETEFRDGVNDITVKGGSFAATTFEGLTQGTGIRIDTNASGTYVYKTFTHQVGIPYVFSCYVRTLDGSVPVLGDQSTDASADFVLVGKGSAIYTPYKSITHLGNGLYRAVAVITNGLTTTSFGVVKYAGNSTKPVIVSGYQLEVGSAVTPYQPFTDFNSEFIKAFPLHTLYQDAAGTIPVTGAGQPIGLVLDKSKGLVLGDELAEAGGFDNATKWTKETGWSVSGGNGIATNANGRIFQDVPSTAGRTYLISGTILSRSTGSVRLLADGADVPIVTTSIPRVFSYIVRASLATIKIGFRSIDGFTGTADNVSVRELSGNHAYNTTSAQRPLLVANPQRLDYDAVDDKLITNLPAQLTGCTVIRAAPNVGTQILTGRTIPATYDDNKDHCGLIVINRALTASETSQITKLFNKAAGV